MSEKPNTIECPECHKEASTVITSGNFILMGSGWYQGGYKK